MTSPRKSREKSQGLRVGKRTLRPVVGLSAATVVLAFAFISQTAGVIQAYAENQENQEDIPITVTVITPSPSPSKTANPDPVYSGNDSPGTSNTPAQNQGTNNTSTPLKTPVATEPPAPAAAPATSDEASLGGVLYVSGIRTKSYTPSLNPLDGKLDLEFTVRNVSQETVTGNSHFWVQGPFGHPLSDVNGVTVQDIGPGESRVVNQTLSGVGQWVIVNTHITFTPPDSVENIAVAPVTRDSFAFIFPWVLLVIALALIASYSIYRVLKERRNTDDNEPGAYELPGSLMISE